MYFDFKLFKAQLSVLFKSMFVQKKFRIEYLWATKVITTTDLITYIRLFVGQ
jgi:hypothetical protein